MHQSSSIMVFNINNYSQDFDNKNVIKIQIYGTFTNDNINFYIKELCKYENCKLLVFYKSNNSKIDIDCADMILENTPIAAVNIHHNEYVLEFCI